jgi:hypothetical protein
MATCDQTGDGCTLGLRRQPARAVEGRPEGGYTTRLSSSAASWVTSRSWLLPTRGLIRISAGPRAVPG